MQSAETFRRALLAISTSLIVASLSTPGCGSSSTEPNQFELATRITLAPAANSTTGALGIGAPARTLVVSNQDGKLLDYTKFTWSMQVVSGTGTVATLTAPNVICSSTGSVRVTAKASNTKAALEASTTVDCAPRTLRITDEPATKVLQVGLNYTYRAEVHEPNGALPPGGQTYTWSSNDPTVASFAQPTSGVLTALKAGSVTITVTSPLVSQSTTTQLQIGSPFVTVVSASPRGASDDLANSRVAVVVPLTRQFQLEDQRGLPVTGVLAWTSSAPAVAEISTVSAGNGLAKCLAGGTTTIRGVDPVTGLAATATLNCLSVTISPPSVSVRQGETTTLTAQVVGATGAVDVNWSPGTSNLEVTKLTSTTASVKGLSPTPTTLPTTVTATYTQGATTATGTALVSVLPSLAPSLSLSPNPLILAADERKPLTSVIQNVVGTPSIAWMSEDPSIASVSSATGTGITVASSNKLYRDALTHIVATMTAGSVTLTSSALVLVGSAPVVLEPKPPAKVAAGGTQQFTLFTISGSGASTGTVPSTEVNWTSSSNIATIDANGLARCSSTNATEASTTITATVKVVAGALARTDFTLMTCLGAGPAQGFTLTPGTVSVVQTAPATPASLTVTRTGGFTGPINVSSTTYTPPGSTIPGLLPTGLTVTATPPTGGFVGNALTFNVSATTAVQPNTYPITVNVSSGLPAQSTTLNVTVTGATQASQVARVVLDPMGLELTSPGTFQYVAHLFNAAGTEITAASDGGVVTFTSANTNIIAVNSLPGAGLGLVNVAGVGSTTVTAVYSRNGTTVASSAASPVLVHSNASPKYTAVFVALPTGSPTISPTIRTMRVGQTVEFELVIKDPNNNSVAFNVDQGIEFTLSSTVLTTPVHSSTTNLLRYSFRANSLPTSSAIPGLPNVVTLQVDIEGAMVKIPIIIVP